MTGNRWLVSKIALASVLLTVAVCGCSPKNKKTKETPTLRAYRLIDQQRTDEAIQLLENELAVTPDNYEYKVILASAYAHKGGIKIQRLVPLFGHGKSLKDLGKKVEDVNEDDPYVEQVNSMAVNTASMFAKFAAVFAAYEAIRVANKDDAVYISQAITILNGLGDQIKPEDAMYRAVLEVILFKYIMSDRLIGEFLPPRDGNKASCRLDLGNVNDAVVTLGKLLIDILNDVGVANPKEAEDMKRLSDKTSSIVSSLTLGMTSVIVLDEASNIFLREAAIQHGFGKTVRCNGK